MRRVRALCPGTPWLQSVNESRTLLCGQRPAWTLVNLPGWCWAEIKQLALIRSSSSLHSEVCNALGASDGVIHSRISHVASCLRALANIRHVQLMKLLGRTLRPFYSMLVKLERQRMHVGTKLPHLGLTVLAIVLGRSPHKNCKNDLDDQT
jgi:hypothetical protein